MSDNDAPQNDPPKNSSRQQPLDELIGKTLGQFTILQEVGRGGMATVYKATQKSINRQVAVKVLPRHFMHDPGFLERFEREVEVISGLEHPHILPIYDYGQDDGVPYIAMRYLGGGSMAELVRRGVPDVGDLEKPFQQVAEALDYAHQQGIIHRDLKPGNIMLDEHGNAYLSDFGIARVMGSDLTGSAIIGTPAYMSPEQAQSGYIDARSDIYSLGIVLFELITGREPFQAETPMSVMLKHLNESLPPIRDFREGVPYAVQDVVDMATAKTPDERYPSATAMAAAFSAALRETSPPVTRPLPESRNDEASVESVVVPQPAIAAPDEVASAQTLPDQTGGNRPLLIAGAVAVLVLLGGIGLIASGALQSETVPLPTPTPFRGASIVAEPEYALSIPEDWVFSDDSNVQRLRHVWQSDDSYVQVALVIVDSGERTVAAYTANYDDDALIDEETAPDGTVRRSYRIENLSSRRNGQLDAFFTVEPQRLVVLEVFTADAIAADAVVLETLQLLLDSLQLMQ